MTWTRRLAACALACLFLAAAQARAEDLERADFKVTLPAGSTVDKPDGDIDADHMTTVNFPNDATFIVAVIDDKEYAPKAWEKMVEVYKIKLKGVVEGKTDTFAKIKPARSEILSGSINGMKVNFEMVQIDGKQKSIILVCAYLQRKKEETVKMMQDSLDTLKIKE